MIEIILSTLAEFGLIHEDYKHKKRISLIEKEDGKKRPFQKYLLQPSVIITICLIFTVSIGVIAFIIYQHTSIYPEKTKKELIKITDWIEKWKIKYDHYPTELNEIIGNNPQRQGWNTDAWDRPYKYTHQNNGIGFSIKFAGKDGQFETKDDIILK
tara:strand:+ start:1584 stop:2051 length:468 start_codon:yes stop_codon:yes gene_type:complete